MTRVERIGKTVKAVREVVDTEAAKERVLAYEKRGKVLQPKKKEGK